MSSDGRLAWHLDVGVRVERGSTLVMILPLLWLLCAGVALLPAVLVLAGRRRRQRVAIPRSELAALGTTIKDADELASTGRVGDGLSCLVAGMRRAQQAKQAGSPGGRELLDRWQSVVDEYATEHRIGPASEIVASSAPDGRGDEMSPTSRPPGGG